MRDTFKDGYIDKTLHRCRCGSARVRIQSGGFAQANDFRARCWDCRVTGVPLDTWGAAVRIWNETHPH